MSMVVQHNMTAMNSNRMLGITTGAQAKSTEKLSSGYKINRAADDAAGLSISEKMRKQIRGLTQASANAQDGISAVQTAEGALAEVEDMLQRMNELAVKAANGTQSENDRQDIQSEIDQLVTEIDRVSTTTKFNETYLLKGRNPDGTAAKSTYDTADGVLSKAFDVTDGYWNKDTGVATVQIATTATTKTNLTAATNINKSDGSGAGDGEDKFSTSTGVTTEAIENTTYKYKDIAIKDPTGAQDMHYILIESTQAVDSDKASLTVSQAVDSINASQDTEFGSADGASYMAFSSMDDLLAQMKRELGDDVKSIVVDSETYKDEITGGEAGVQLKITAFADQNNAMNLSLHVGADSANDNKIDMSINAMSARGLGVNGLYVGGDTADNATRAIDTIADAIKMVSAQRSSLGAVQNRLEHTIKNLDNVVENTTSAESQIRDTDMASEMVTYSKNNILAQAGQSMLAQANQSNQGVLSLLG